MFWAGSEGEGLSRGRLDSLVGGGIYWWAISTLGGGGIVVLTAEWCEICYRNRIDKRTVPTHPSSWRRTGEAIFNIVAAIMISSNLKRSIWISWRGARSLGNGWD